MKYFTQNNVKFIQCAVSELSIQMNDSTKKNVNESTYINAGFFGWYDSADGKAHYTLPVCPLVADIRTTNKYAIDDCTRRTKVMNNKVYYDSFTDSTPWNTYYQHGVTTFVIENGVARLEENTGLKDSYQFAVGGVGLIRNGKQVTWSQIKSQGFGSDSLYATMHSLIGMKKGDSSVYLINWKSTTGNMVSSGEAYKKFSAMGFTELLKLDGGGSCIMKANGQVKAATSENRRICSIIVVKDNGTNPSSSSGSSSGSSGSSGSSSSSSSYKNPYPVPTRTLSYGCKGNDVRWLQYSLTYKCGIKTDVDGSFGPSCRSSVITFQKRYGLDPDGFFGPKSRAKMLSL